MDDPDNPQPAIAETDVEHLAQRLREVAEKSAGNKAAVMYGIKQEYQHFGFGSAEEMAKFVFSRRTRMT
jgi:hypothetical protein